MASLYLFNPENDLALVQNNATYTAPSNAIRLHNAGALIPMWFCNNDDIIVAPNTNLEWVKQIHSKFEINGTILNASNISTITELKPWGWSKHVCQQFIDSGINKSLLPTTEQLDKMRMLSHRRITIEISKYLQEQALISNPTIPFEAKCEQDILNFAHKHNSFYIKSPWSSSGRGVINSSSMCKAELIRQALGMINRQGSVICEKALDKVKDFAMLFYSDGNTIKYLGLSYFYNTETGTYLGNIIDSQDNILQEFNNFNTTLKISELSHILASTLSKLICPHYIGYLGVDMMIYKNDNKFEIAPCVELNLRMTMGTVPLLWSSKHLAKGAKGIMQIEYNPNNNATPHNNAIIVDKRLKSGTISLIPPDKYFNITISVK